MSSVMRSVREAVEKYRVTHVFILTFWSDRKRGMTETFYYLDAAKRFSRRKSWRKLGDQWFCETNLGIYRIRRKRIRGRKPWA